MKFTTFKVVKIIIILIIINTVAAKPAQGGGLFATNIFVQAIPSEFKALIVFDGKKETIFDSTTFNINPVIAWNFAYIMAVPSKPNVELVLDNLDQKLEKLTEKEAIQENIPPRVYTRPLDFVKFEIFGPDKTEEELKEYLAEGGYIIPKDGNRVVQEYFDKKWYFIVAEVNTNHLQMEASESLTVPGAHTFPLKIDFQTDEIVYPLKLARVQPDYDTENVALNYEYGSKSEAVLGIKDEKADDMLSVQSKNKYPRIPFDYSYQKIELFVVSNHKAEAPGFKTFYSSGISDNDLDFKDFKENKYYQLPKHKMYLTAQYGFVPTIQLEDIYLKQSSNKFSIVQSKFIKLISQLFKK